MKYCFICNPMAGKEKNKEELVTRINSICTEKEVEYDILITSSVGDGRELVKKYYGENSDEEIAFFACGGDGTAGEVVNGIMSLPCRDKVSMGIIPVGTGNDFVRNFSGKENFLDISAQIDSMPVSVDVLKCNDMYALNMINIGFDCEVVCKMSEIKRKPFIPSKFAYIAGLIITLIKKPGVKMNISVDGGESEEKKLLLTTFANGCFCGGGFHSNPNADITGGKIDYMFIKNVSRTKFLTLVGSYKKGTHICEKNAKIIDNGSSDTCKIIFDKTTNVSVDGEVIGFDSIDLSLEKAALNFRIPLGSERLKTGAAEEVAAVL